MNLNYPQQFNISKQVHLVISVWDEKNIITKMFLAVIYNMCYTSFTVPP